MRTLKIELTEVQRSDLFDLVLNYRDGVADGSISGYGQSKEEELDYVAELLAKLKD